MNPIVGTIASTVLCAALIVTWYVSIFHGGFISYTTSILTTTRIGVHEIGSLVLSKSSMAPGASPGMRSSLGYTNANLTGLLGFPGFVVDSYSKSGIYASARAVLVSRSGDSCSAGHLDSESRVFVTRSANRETVMKCCRGS